jgi:hypothetical protein
MTKPRKYKAKPPISQLDDVAAEHRRAQSCKAQRAYRKRKEDTIATLTTQISDLETTIERLSGCFLGLNDRVLEYLRTIDAENDRGSADLAEGIRDVMKEFKTIIESEDVQEKTSNGEKEVYMVEAKDIDHSSPAQQIYPSPAASLSYDIPVQQQPSYETPVQKQPSTQILPSTSFSGPSFFGLTPTTLPHHPSALTTAASTQNLQDLARRLYHTTINKSYSIVYTPGPPSALFRRVYACYFTGEPEQHVKQKVIRMMEQRLTWSCFDKLTGSAPGWWSALQVAGFLVSQGGWFDRERDRLVVRRDEGEVSVAVEGLLDGKCKVKGKRDETRMLMCNADFLVDARCGMDDPEYREDTVVRAIMKVMG